MNEQLGNSRTLFLVARTNLLSDSARGPENPRQCSMRIPYDQLCVSFIVVVVVGAVTVVNEEGDEGEMRTSKE